MPSSSRSGFSSLAPSDLASALNIANHCVTVGDQGWIDHAKTLFKKDGFVVVRNVIELAACAEVRDACEDAAKRMAHPSGSMEGNRGLGRYSFGLASLTGGMLHYPAFAKYLLDCASLHSLLPCIFEDEGYVCLSAGGDFVLPCVYTDQHIHSDLDDQDLSAHSGGTVWALNPLPCSLTV